MDPYLPILTTEQADRLRSLALERLSRHGVYATLRGKVLWTDDRRMPLDNLAHLCRSASYERWPQLVDAHFSALDHADRGSGAPARLLRGVYLRLIPDDCLPPEAADGFRYLRPVAEGLLEAMALDTPDSVRLLDDQDVARAGLETLRSAARTNLANEPVEHEAVRGPDGTVIHIVSGASMFVASKALVLAELMWMTLGQEAPEEGVLVTVPSRHQLAFHPITDGGVVNAVNDLAAFGLGAYQDNPGPVSPRLYWWQHGRLTSLTTIDHDSRRFSIAPPEELLTIMKRLKGS